MSKLDKIKEELNYLKVWLGVFIVAAMALIGWLAEHIDNNFKSYLAMVKGDRQQKPPPLCNKATGYLSSLPSSSTPA